MSEEKMSCFYELINGFEIVGTLTDDGRKLIKEGVLYLYQENQRLNADLIKEEVSYIALKDTYNKKCDECKLYKEVIDEVRESKDEYVCTEEYCGEVGIKTTQFIEKLGQILDKAKENK